MRIRFVASGVAIFASAFLTVAISEFALRFVNIPPPPPLGWGWLSSPYKSEANRSDLRMNEFGLRGRSIEYDSSDLIVLIVGDSYVEAGAQPFEDMPEQLLEQALQAKISGRRVRTYSIAAAGWGQDQQLLALEAFFKSHRADLVINWFTPVNDYWENTFVDRSVDASAGPLKPTFRIDDEDKLRLETKIISKIRLLELFRIAAAQISSVQKVWRSEIYASSWDRSLPPATLLPVAESSCPNTLVAQDQIVPAFRRGVSKMTAVTTERVAEARTHFAPFLIPTSPRELYQIDITGRLLAKMGALAEMYGAKFFIFYPEGTDIDNAIRSVHCVKSSDVFIRVDENDPLGPLRNSSVESYLMPVRIQTLERTTLSDTDWHLNRLGNNLALRLLADTILASGANVKN